MRLTIAWTRLDMGRRWRSLAVLALLVALSTATVMTALAGARRGQTAFSRLWARTLPATVTVLPNQPHFNWSRIAALPEVASVGRFAVSAFNIVGFPAKYQMAQSFPTGGGSVLHSIERPVVFQGRVVNPRRADEIDVSPLFVKNFGKGVGDTLTIQLATPQQIDQGHDPYNGYPALGRKLKVHIVGVVRAPFFSDSVGDPGFLIPSSGLLAHYRADILGSHSEVYVNALVRLKGGEKSIPKFRADLARVTGLKDIQVWDNKLTFGVPLQRDTGYEAASLFAFGLAALAAAVFLVGQSVSRYAAASISDLQMLRAPGITPRQATVAAAAGPFLAGVAGATLGVAGAIVASNWMPIGAASLVEPSPGISADWVILGPGWVVALVLLAAGSLISGNRAVVAARDLGPQRRSVIAAVAVSAGAPVPVLVGTRFALEPGRGRSALPVRPALVGAVAGVLGVLAAYTFSAGVSDAATNPARFGQTFQLEAFLGLDGQDIGPAAQVMRAVAHSHQVTGVDDARSSIAQDGQVSIATYTYSPVAGKRMPLVLTSGRLPVRPDQIVLATTTASYLHATVGSLVHLTGARRQPLPFRVTGISFVPEGPHNDYDSGGWLTNAGYDQLYQGAPSFKFHMMLVVLRPGVTVAAATRRLNALAASFKGGGAITFGAPQLPEEVLEVRDVAVLPFALGGFLVLLALGAVGHALATAVRRRRHELAVLRALGITRIQSRLVVVTQATALAVIGLAFGVPLGVILGRVTWRLVAQNTPLAYHAPQAVIALALVAPVALLTANLLAAWPGHRAARLRSAQILRTE